MTTAAMMAKIITPGLFLLMLPPAALIPLLALEDELGEAILFSQCNDDEQHDKAESDQRYPCGT